VITSNPVYGIYSGSTGVSALDNENGILYYAADLTSTVINSVDLGSKQLNPPIDIDASKILEFRLITYLYMRRDYTNQSVPVQLEGEQCR